jgi:hypothetical protein
MKKIFIIMGLIVTTLSFGQVTGSWNPAGSVEYYFTLYGDTTIIAPSRLGNFFGKYTIVDIAIKNPEDNTGVLSLGSSNRAVTLATGVDDFKSISVINSAANPLTIDTTGTILKYNADSTWWGVALEFEHLTGKQPAIKYVANTCDSVIIQVLFTIGQ